MKKLFVASLVFLIFIMTLGAVYADEHDGKDSNSNSNSHSNEADHPNNGYSNLLTTSQDKNNNDQDNHANTNNPGHDDWHYNQTEYKYHNMTFHNESDNDLNDTDYDYNKFQNINLCKYPDNDSKNISMNMSINNHSREDYDDNGDHFEHFEPCNVTNSTNSTLTDYPTIDILSPESLNYNYGNILLNISSNGSNIWYNINGTNVTYITPLYLNLSDGNYTLDAYANNSYGNVNQSYVTFNVQNSTMVPESVSNLTAQYISNNSIYWNWTNPNDTNFAYSLVFFNGINVQNSTANFYNATGLNPDTAFTIIIETLGLDGIINDTFVSDTESTLP